MTVGQLKDILEGFDEDLPVIVKGVNTDYVESISSYDLIDGIRAFWGDGEGERLMLTCDEQIGMVDY